MNKEVGRDIGELLPCIFNFISPLGMSGILEDIFKVLINSSSSVLKAA